MPVFGLVSRFSESRGRGIRTPIGGFGDRSSAIELFPYLAHHDTIA